APTPTTLYPFPYTTLFRSFGGVEARQDGDGQQLRPARPVGRFGGGPQHPFASASVHGQQGSPGAGKRPDSTRDGVWDIVQLQVQDRKSRRLNSSHSPSSYA